MEFIPNFVPQKKKKKNRAAEVCTFIKSIPELLAGILQPQASELERHRTENRTAVVIAGIAIILKDSPINIPQLICVYLTP
jgi:hypothetical protein